MLDDLMGQMQNMMADSQKKLDEVIIEVEKEGVKVACTANKKMKDVSISTELLQSNDKEMIEDLLLAAINEALDKAEEKSKAAVNDIAGGLLPGGLGNLFGK